MTKPILGQRLREWREANGLSIEETAQRLGYLPSSIEYIENGASVTPGIIDEIEALITQPTDQPLTPDEQALVQRVVDARRAGLVVTLIRPATAEYGQVAVTFGDDEWRKWI